jgi:DNA transposition AAA+ family ATPase
MEKTQIVNALRIKIEKLGISQNESAKRIGISAATLSNILSGKWENITDAWRVCEQWLGSMLSSWVAADIANYKIVTRLCQQAQEAQSSKAISYQPASGKTFAAKQYAQEHQNTFYVGAVGDMTKRQFLAALCTAMGVVPSYAVSEMLADVITKLKVLNNPLIIVDEFDELKDNAMRIFKDLYNAVGCGFVLIGGLNFKNRILRGATRQKQSYQEILSRIGKEFYELRTIDNGAITKVVNANGINDKDQVNEILTAAQGDLRRVKALVEAIRNQQKTA